MSCCSEFVIIDCFDFCSTISLGFNATETGAHTIEVYVVNGVILSIQATYTIGNDMTIAAGALNEVKDHDIRIKMPSGTYYQFASGVDCARLTTQIHIT